MGEVYSAQDTKLDRRVALKVLPEHLSNDPQALARFEREAKAVAALSHPNILAIHDFGIDGGITYAVAELLEGETLRTRIAGSALPWRKALEIGVALAEGLSVAHSRGIIHRDLKPENIFLTSDGRVKILDFGLARNIPAVSPNDETLTAAETEPGTVLGTAPYMSPEQVKGERVGAVSDIFSLGCVLYEMVAGRRAFARSTSAETLAAILRDSSPRLPPSGVPPEFGRILERCLEKNPGERMQSARDLSFALKGLLPGSGTPGQPRPTRGFGLKPAHVVGAALFASALLFIKCPPGARLCPAMFRFRFCAVARCAAVGEPVSDPDQEYFADGMTEALISSLARFAH
jgi:serine/threonine protein kinase